MSQQNMNNSMQPVITDQQKQSKAEINELMAKVLLEC